MQPNENVDVQIIKQNRGPVLVVQELNDWFDETWEPDAIQAVTESFGIKPPDGGWDTLQNSEKLRKEFTDNMIDWMFGEGGSWSTWKSSGIPTHLGRG